MGKAIIGWAVFAVSLLLFLVSLPAAGNYVSGMACGIFLCALYDAIAQ